MTIEPLRLCEYQTQRVGWTREQREAIAAAAEAWRDEHRLPISPLAFEGVDGCTLRVQQYVGIIEAGGVCVEIYPKLDAALMAGAILDTVRASSVMGNLLWLLEESGYGGLVDAGEASVEDAPEAIGDLLAWLFAKRMSKQLAFGAPQDFIARSDDIPLVRGRIRFARQASALFNRPDTIACQWDEFTSDTPLARLLRCAAEILLARVRLPAAAADLRKVIGVLEEAESVSSLEALSGTAGICWSRRNARWRACHDLALSILQGLGRTMHAGRTKSFVFLLNMNALFESFCARWLEQRFGVPVYEQVRLGHLLGAPSERLGQDADFVWHAQSAVFVGDAKYKIAGGESWPRIDDVRQLICYGQLAVQKYAVATSHLMILHPTVGAEVAQVLRTFDGQMLTLQAVRVVRGAGGKTCD
ncbi:MAG: McrBC restriction endonuclease system subunit McrC [Chthoniobacteraceae bacterium]|nr:McrBC restriction endonuclease system subunit McrC [Chthoniobacteraceae bacterium]